MPNYFVIVIPPKGRILSLLTRGVYETDKLVEYYSKLGCAVSVSATN